MTTNNSKPVAPASPANPQPEALDEPVGVIQQIWTSLTTTVLLGVICCGLYPALIWVIGQTIFPDKANGSLVTKDGAYTSKEEEAVGSALLGQSFSAPQYFHPRSSAAGNGYDATSSGGTNLGPLSDKLINGATATTPPATQPADASATQPAAAVTTQPTTQPTAAATRQPTETLAYDGIRLRTMHFAMDNGIAFKLYTIKPDGTRIAEVPLAKYLDKDGDLNDIVLVDAFPHPPTDAADKTPLIAADFSTRIPADAVTTSASGLDPHISPRNAELQKPRVAKARNLGEDAVQKLIDQYTDQPSLGVLGDPGVNVLMLNLALDKAAPVQPPATAPAPASAPGK